MTHCPWRASTSPPGAIPVAPHAHATPASSCGVQAGSRCIMACCRASLHEDCMRRRVAPSPVQILLICSIVGCVVVGSEPMAAMYHSMAMSWALRQTLCSARVRETLPRAHTASASCCGSMCTICSLARCSCARASVVRWSGRGWGASASLRSAMIVEDRRSAEGAGVDGCAVDMHAVDSGKGWCARVYAGLEVQCMPLEEWPGAR